MRRGVAAVALALVLVQSAAAQVRGDAVISGRVLDEHGEPVADARVQAFRTQYAQGIRRLVTVRGAQSNDLGQFRIFGLPAGKYYVAASIRAAGGGPIEIVARDSEVMRGGSGFAPTFYPGTVNAADAQAVTVSAGAEVAGIEFALTPVRLARLSGAIVDSRGKPLRDYLVILNAARSDSVLLTNTTMVEADAEGRFTLPDIAPGDYRIDVRAKREIEAIAHTGGVGQPQSSDAGEFANVPITIAGEDVEGLTITATRGYRLSGRIEVEGSNPSATVMQSIKLSAFEVSSGATLSGPMLAAAAVPQNDGSFELRGLIGTRILRVSGLPKGWTLKSVRAGGRDVTDEGIQMADDVRDVDVVIGTRQTRIAGDVRDEKGKPLPNAAVIIFPEEKELRSLPMNRFVRSQRVAEDGTFTFDGLPPGRYYAEAVNTLIDGEWAEPENLERLTARAAKFSLNEGENRTLMLKLERRSPR